MQLELFENLRQFGSLNFWLKIHLKYVFFKKKINNKNEIERNFIVGHCIIFSNFFCLIISYEPQT
jgi:hypothetical protein